MIVYKLTNGIATDIRFVPENYSLQPNETLIKGDVLPSQESLSDPEAWAAATGSIDLSNLDNLERSMKALALLNRAYSNNLKAEIRGLAVLLINKGVITAAEANGLLTFDGTGPADSKTVADLKADFAAIYTSLS